MWNLIFTVIVTCYIMVGLVNFIIANIAFVYDPEVSMFSRKKKLFLLLGVTFSGFFLEIFLGLRGILSCLGYDIRIEIIDC